MEMDNGKPVDHPDPATVKVRQGTGPRTMVSVLLISLLAAATIGAALLYYFFFVRPPVLPPGV
jgi:hypothetical protein